MESWEQLRYNWVRSVRVVRLVRNTKHGVFLGNQKSLVKTAKQCIAIEPPFGTTSQIQRSKSSQQAKTRSPSEVSRSDEAQGYIDSVEPVSFKLRDPKDGTSQSIAYSELESVSKAGRGVSTKTWLIVGGIAAGAVTTFLIVKPAVCDGGAQSRGLC